MSFHSLGISSALVDLVEKKGFDAPTAIQAKSIPLILEGKDVIGKSHTGSGKTLAFSAGIIDQLKRGKGLGALVLTPTRELAQQVADAIAEFSVSNPLHIAAVYGGVAYGPQEKAMEKADVIVATPGRLSDHIERGTVDLSNISVLVLDEADRMLDMGFIEAVTFIVEELPTKRQTLLFSATISGELTAFCDNYMHKPTTISVGEHVDPSKLKQVYYDVRSFEKMPLLVTLLREEHYGLIIVFCNTRQGVDMVEKHLKANKISATAIHGGFTQNKRMRALQTFQSEKAEILVCTDVAARGLDIRGVTHVYNFDLPADPKEYVHRIGRTARAGKDGKVINILSQRDYDNFGRILDTHKTIDVEQLDVPQLERIAVVQRPPRTSRGGRGGRPSHGRKTAHRGRRR